MINKVAKVIAQMKRFSDDPHTQVGACIVQEGKIISKGCNHFPLTVNDHTFPTKRDGTYLETKYPYMIHAEADAIMSANENLAGSHLYVSMFPCSDCAKMIIQVGIKWVTYFDDPYSHTDQVKAAKILFDRCGVTHLKYSV